MDRRSRSKRSSLAPLIDQARRSLQPKRVHELEFPTGIAIDNKAHPAYTLIQIETPDRVGLLYDLLTALGREGVEIALSRISTQKGGAIDTFYVCDDTGRGKITDSNRIATIQHRLRAAYFERSRQVISTNNWRIQARPPIVPKF